MIIGAIKEHFKEETRTPLTPLVVKVLIKLGHTVLIEKDIGKKSNFSNQEYSLYGAKFSTPKEIYQNSDILLQIIPPQNHLINSLNKNQILISDFSIFDFSKISSLATFIRLEKVPRTSIAQSIDILSTQHTIRGYSSGIYSLYQSNHIAPQLFTASTSIPQAKALIIGASITGLQASSTLKRNGVDVTIADINEHVKELAYSVGANFINSKDIVSNIENKNFIISAVGSFANSPKIISLNQLKNIKTNTLIIDTTSNNIDINRNFLHTKYFTFYRNIYFERLFPNSASILWSNNILNLIKTIITNNKLDLSLDYIKPMIFNTI